MLLGELLGLSDKLSSYTARHTRLRRLIIVKSIRHYLRSDGTFVITVTETYLKPFRSKKELMKQIDKFLTL